MTAKETPAEAARRRYHEDPAGQKARIAKYWRAHPEVRMLQQARMRAKRRGMACTISRHDIVIPSHCPVLGIRLSPGVGHVAPTSPVLDRIDNTKGYVPGNVCVISHRANTLKGDGTADEHLAIARYMREHALASASPAPHVPVQREPTAAGFSGPTAPNLE